MTRYTLLDEPVTVGFHQNSDGTHLLVVESTGFSVFPFFASIFHNEHVVVLLERENYNLFLLSQDVRSIKKILFELIFRVKLLTTPERN